MYGLLASGVALLHGLLVVCVVAGSTAAICGRMRRRPKLARWFYSLLLLVIASDLLLGECFLTLTEQQLLNLSDPGSAYRGSYIGNYFGFLPPFLHRWIGPALVVSALLAWPIWLIADRRQCANPTSQEAR